jgi:hypothetical protein
MLAGFLVFADEPKTAARGSLAQHPTTRAVLRRASHLRAHIPNPCRGGQKGFLHRAHTPIRYPATHPRHHTPHPSTRRTIQPGSEKNAPPLAAERSIRGMVSRSRRLPLRCRPASFVLR